MRTYAVMVQCKRAYLYDANTGAPAGCVGFNVVAAQALGGGMIQVTTSNGDIEIYNAATGAPQSGVSRIHSYLSPPPRPVENDHGQPADRDTRGERIGVIILCVFVGIIWVLPLPGTLINWLSGRFANDPNGLFIASRGDGWTWLISVGFWLVLALILIGVVGWFDRTK